VCVCVVCVRTHLQQRDAELQSLRTENASLKAEVTRLRNEAGQHAIALASATAAAAGKPSAAHGRSGSNVSNPNQDTGVMAALNKRLQELLTELSDKGTTCTVLACGVLWPASCSWLQACPIGCLIQHVYDQPPCVFGAHVVAWLTRAWYLVR